MQKPAMSTEYGFSFSKFYFDQASTRVQGYAEVKKVKSKKKVIRKICDKSCTHMKKMVQNAVTAQSSSLGGNSK